MIDEKEHEQENEMEIKCCPFCGAPAELISTTFGDSNVEYFRVICRNGDALDNWDSPEAAVKVWNRRFPVFEQPAEQMEMAV